MVGFISSSLSQIISQFFRIGKEKGHLIDGEYFGGISIMKDMRRTATVVALETCELYRLSKDDFYEVILPGSDVWHQIDIVANDRIRINSERNVF